MSEYAQQRQEARERLDASLVEYGFSKVRLVGGSPFGGDSFTVCQKCGAAIMLGDVEELVQGMQTERGVRLHSVWHRTHESPPQTEV